jgi:hypothetical protein
MFVTHELPVTASFAVAQARLTSLARGRELVDASRAAYSLGLVGLLLPGPSGDVEGISKLAAVRFLDHVHREEAMTLGLRWEVAGVAGGLVPVLDADFRLTPQGGQATRLALSGSYRPPPRHPGISLDRSALNRAAAATIRILLRDVASALVTPGAAAGRRSGPAACPGQPPSSAPGTSW